MNDDGVKDAFDPTGGLIKTKDQALGVAQSLLENVRAARSACNVALTVRDAHRAHRVFMTRFGAALGAIGILYRVGLLEAAQFNRLRQEINATMIATVTTVRA